MRRAILILALLLPAFASAQMMQGDHPGGTMMMAPAGQPAAGVPTQPGQGAFAAIQEIVEILQADPTTDWSKVNIEALRQHLIDMDNVTLHADVKSEPFDGGMMFIISGADPIRGSIQRMVVAHAATMDGIGGWHFIAVTTDTGATLTVTTPASEVQKLRGLGFIGVLTHGMHHQMHHLMIARGGDPHHG
jgi:P2-related tail formation protein